MLVCVHIQGDQDKMHCIRIFETVRDTKSVKLEKSCFENQVRIINQSMIIFEVILFDCLFTFFCGNTIFLRSLYKKVGLACEARVEYLRLVTTRRGGP